MNKFNEFRLQCKSKALLGLLISIVSTLILLGISGCTRNNLALNVILYLSYFCILCMGISLLVMIWYVFSAFVAILHRKRNVIGSELIAKYDVNSVDPSKLYNISYVYGLFLKKFVVDLEECNEQ